jgi:hypothetical protein
MRTEKGRKGYVGNEEGGGPGMDHRRVRQASSKDLVLVV